MLEKGFKRVLGVKSINFKIGLAVYIMSWGNELSFICKSVGGGQTSGSISWFMSASQLVSSSNYIIDEIELSTNIIVLTFSLICVIICVQGLHL